jgi:cysteinyl-tRNA synthetase
MDDDFTTPNALAALYELSSIVNDGAERASAKELKYALSKFKKLAKLLGLKLKPKKVKARKIGTALADYVKELHEKIRAKAVDVELAAELPKSEDDIITYVVELRQRARKKGLYDMSDAIRAKLAEMGVVIEDTIGGAKWKRA